jgi:hypothetical protein
MDPVVVPAPPRSAYNQNRRVSDLLYNQLRHFQHVVLKRGDLGIDPEIARNIHTEGGAAKYIAAVTRALRGRPLAASAPSVRDAIMATPSPSMKPEAGMTLSIAVAETSSVPRRGPAKKAAQKGAATNSSLKPHERKK